jgi:hypothetical protein
MDELHKLYKSQGYFSIHGTDMLITMALLISTCLISGMTSYQGLLFKIRSDWDNKRCSPILLPFAGYLMPVEGKTTNEVNQENMTYCMKQDMSAVLSIAILPLEFSLYVMVEFLDTIEEGIRSTMSVIRYVLNAITAERDKFYNRLTGFVVPVVEILLYVRDAMAKTNGIMTVALYTVMNIYNIVVSGSINLMKVLSNLIITVTAILIALSIAGLILMPILPPVGIPMYLSAVAMLVVTVIPSIIIYTTMRIFIMKISKERPNKAPPKPTIKKRKK